MVWWLLRSRSSLVKQVQGLIERCLPLYMNQVAHLHQRDAPGDGVSTWRAWRLPGPHWKLERFAGRSNCHAPVQVQAGADAYQHRFVDSTDEESTHKKKTSLAFNGDAFCCVVWKKMEETNPEFFKAYHAQLRVKEQERSVPFRRTGAGVPLEQRWLCARRSLHSTCLSTSKSRCCHCVTRCLCYA